jgi:hypothetical protein
MVPKLKLGRIHRLNHQFHTQRFMNFSTVVTIPQIRHGFRQTFDIQVSKEAILLAEYLRQERRQDAEGSK